ncbi:hypothetical protein OJ967_25365 [Peribacillus frigoritolerans]|uniref:hypothetical protein n=1 Tax=Peribacillus frigoritolerans TaxID=450367 RepID=UPI002227923E|nr:hypothetical protein [Peribacillus frigoritolerans]UYY98642.1 hypothetical protein OJ967_25365 [Peribacillus frigoritolerans]
MIVDAKREILTALFVEYQKDIPNFNNVKIKFAEAGMDSDTFNVAILKLENEGFINNVDFIKGGRKPFGIQTVRLDNALLTGQTARYLEEKLELELDNEEDGEEKSKNILKRFADAGFERAENVLAKTIAELIKA